MKRFGLIVACLAVAGVLAVSAPAEAKVNTKCVIAFSQTFPKVMQDVVKVADPASIDVDYDIDAAKLQYAADICFKAKKDGKVSGKKVKKGNKYCATVKCGKVTVKKK